MLAAPFRPRKEFAPTGPYRLLPFRFGRLDDHRYIATNDVGEYVVLSGTDLRAFVEHRLATSDPAYGALKAKHFLMDEGSRTAVDLLALKYRTRLESLSDFTALHIFVVTLRCDHSCHYCQVSRQTEERQHYDMSAEHAEKALAMAFRSPAQHLKIEFQGGEPLLCFDRIRHVVERAEALNAIAGKDVRFVIASNLSRLTEDVLVFCKDHRIVLSTSLDGPRDLHDAQRPFRGGSSYDSTLAGIQRARLALGDDAVAALMTTTPRSLSRVIEIIDEYVRADFHSIFLRPVSPYGFAVRSGLVRKYGSDDWTRFYEKGLAHILRINEAGFPLREDYTAILLQKIFSPSGTSYVDLQSPAGLGISAIVYNYDGSVYASDEGRMLAEVGDHTFRLGHLDRDGYEEMMTAEALVSTLDQTMLEGAPMCSECPFLPYCGSDPVFHKATQGDVVGHKALSEFCRRQMAMVRHLLALLEDNPAAREILMTWV